jgi:putative copper export protein
VLAITLGDIRLFLHLLGATVWVGGQLIFVALVPVVRRFGPDVMRPVARHLTRILWAGFALLLVTGIWNLVAVDLSHQSSAYRTTLMIKLGAVALSGVAAAVHMVVSTPRARALWGTASGVGALAALLLGVVLAG